MSVPVPPLASPSRPRVDGELYRRGQFITALARALSVALALLCLALMWDSPRTRPWAAGAVLAGYGSFLALVLLRGRGRPPSRAWKAAHDVADALAVGLGAASSGGLESPIWLFLYPHVVAVSVRGGLAYALAMGVLDAVIVLLLTAITPQQPLGALHALALVFCAFMGGTTSSYLHATQRRLRRMEQDLKAHAERLAALNEIAGAVNLSLTIEDIFKVAAEEARRLVPFDRLTLALLDPGEGPVEIVAVSEGVARQRAAFGREGIAWALRRPQAWAEGAGEEEPPQLRALLAAESVRAVATVPLFSKDRVIGSLNLGRTKATPFSTYDLALMEPVARHIAIALDNARLLEALRLRGKELGSILEIGRRIGERTGLEDVLDLVTRSVNRVMGTDHCLVLLRDGNRLQVMAQQGLEPEVVAAFRDLHVGQSLSGWVIQEGRVLAVADMREDPRLMFGELVQRYGYRSYLGAPLRRGTETIGTLEVVTKSLPRRFGTDEQALMAAFADQAAVAIDNARLLADARDHLATVVEANRRLEELDRLRREYLRNVSHEFRSPLTLIKGYADFLGDVGGSPEEVRESMRVVAEGCDRVIDLVETLIDVSRVEQEGAERTLILQRLDLRELAEGSLDGLRRTALRKGVDLALEFPPGELWLDGDRGLLQHLVRKLVDNAVKYSARGQRVLVRGHPEGGVLTLEVEDRGIGIPPDHVGRIFEKFYMVDGSLTRGAGGTGVGLYLVREIVRLHHGTVAVESRPGQGSTFRVCLPRLIPPPARARA